MSGLKYLVPLLRQNRLMILAGFLCLGLCDLANLTIPTVMGRAIDLMGLPTTARRDLLAPMGRILLLAAAVATLRFGWRHFIIGFSRRAEMALRGLLYEKIVRLPLSWHLRQKSGDLMAMAANDVESVRQALNFGLISVTDTVIMGCVSLFFMASISPGLTWRLLLPMLAIPVVTHFLGRRLYRLVLAVQDAFGELTEIVRERLAGLRVIRAMGLGHLAIGETGRVGRLYLEANVRQAKLAGAFFPFLHLMSNVSAALAIYLGGRETMAGHISTGDFVAFITYLAMLTWPLMALGMVIGFLQQGLASLDRLGRVYGAESARAGGGALTAPPADAPLWVEFTGLTFTYPGRETPALKDIRLTLSPTEFTALVGPVGAGKSTLAALLPALYEAGPGMLRVAGQEVEKWPLAALRGRFGYVPQNGYLFSATIFENIAFGRPDATEAEVRQAAEAAGLAEDLAAFPEGLATVVGERGVTLSGGQRQRLALARALLLDPDYLILDDTLSAVDASVEAAIMGRLPALRRGRGTLTITHRLTSLTGVDRVVTLADGRVTDDGPPAELLRRDTYFRHVYELSRR